MTPQDKHSGDALERSEHAGDVSLLHQGQQLDKLDMKFEFSPHELSGEEDPPDPEKERREALKAERRLARQENAKKRRRAQLEWWQRSWRKCIAVGGVLLVLGVLASWFALPVRDVVVRGNVMLDSEEVRTLAGLSGRKAWLYYGKEAQGLLRNPWIQSAHVKKIFPSTIEVQIKERTPVLRTVDQQPHLIANDGKLLPYDVHWKHLPIVQGWGPTRFYDAALVTEVLSRYTVKKVIYTPSGLTVKTATGTVWSGDLKSFLKYVGSISMYPNATIHIYPWGVSVQQ